VALLKLEKISTEVASTLDFSNIIWDTSNLCLQVLKPHGQVASPNIYVHITINEYIPNSQADKK